MAKISEKRAVSPATTQRQVASRAHCDATNLGDRGLRQLVQRQRNFAHVSHSSQLMLLRTAAREIGSAAELTCSAGDHDCPIIYGTGDLAERSQQFIPHHAVHRVLLGWAVQSDCDDALSTGDLHCFHVGRRY